MNRLSKDVQALFCASMNINSFNRAVEELVYNSLDAKATSIAIRINVQNGKIQVVDNGCGIPKNDMKVVGQKYMTSKKNTNNSTNNSCTYGFRGQALANIVGVSKSVNIISKYQEANETFSKVFLEGKQKSVTKVDSRPSKGTTIDIEGFLYNLNIQKKNVEPLHEIQEIKSFLERLSLVHSNTSLSLRNDENYEIVFKLPKSKDIYQTLKMVFGIDKQQITELKVEKKAYAVTAFIEKTVGSSKNNTRIIFLNEKFLKPCKLLDILNKSLQKHLGLKTLPKRIQKSKRMVHETEVFTSSYLPFYFIFIKCPSTDYEIHIDGNKTVVEFKNWTQINDLLEKLVQFYTGVAKPKDVPNNKMDFKENETHTEVKKIVEKLLASKKLGVSQMHNGIKGKVLKRPRFKKKQLLQQCPNKHVKYSPLKEVTENKTDKFMDNKQKERQTIEEKQLTVELCEKNHINESSHNPYININSGTKSKKNILSKGAKISKANIKKKRHNRTLNTAFKNITDTIKKRCDFIAKRAERKLNRIRIQNQKKSPVSRQVKDAEVQIQDDTLTKYENKHNQMNRKYETKNMRQEAGKTTYENLFDLYLDERNNKILERNMIQNMKEDKNRRREEKDKHQQLAKYMQPIFTPSNMSEVLYKECSEENAPKNYDLIHTILKTQKDNFEMHHREVPLNQKYNNLRLTYESHQYNQYLGNVPETTKHHKFITEQSIENFSMRNFKNPNVFMNSKYKGMKQIKRNYNYKTSIYNIAQESVTIEVSNTIDKRDTTSDPTIDLQSIENFIRNDNFLADFLEKLPMKITENTSSVFNSKQATFGTIEKVNSNDDSFRLKTYSVNTPLINNFDEATNSSGTNIKIQTGEMSCKTYTVESPIINTFDLKKCSNLDNNFERKLNESGLSNNNINVIFVSDSQNTANDIERSNISNSIDPLQICEAFLGHQSASKEGTQHKSQEDNFDEKRTDNPSLLETSHYFNITHLSDWNTIPESNKAPETSKRVTQQLSNISTETIKRCGETYRVHRKTGMVVDNEGLTKENIGHSHFELNNRPFFMPKGLSPILTNCNPKNACNYSLDGEYFAEELYDDFLDNVEKQAEIYDAQVENVNELLDRNIGKVQDRIKKDGASLNFDGKCLEDVKVLGQIDCKFIATKLKGCKSDVEYLVLFDQHAVHERILLEENMAGYLKGNQWKCITVDLSIKLKNDDLLYVHNYKDKFAQLGLTWTVEKENELRVSSIPKAIMGKNVRQADVIIKAVKMLIDEEIQVLKHQRGSLALYPKVIMDLVFSEACRYAIMFGDALTIQECEQLLRDLSKCKTPFQCAHGRPVMTVLLDLKPYIAEYKIDFNKVNKWRKVLKTH